MDRKALEQPQRPWILRTRAKSWRTGKWSKWRSYATFATWDSATRRAGALMANDREAKVFHRDTLKDLHRLGAAA